MTTRLRLLAGLLIGAGLAFSGFLMVPVTAQNTNSNSGAIDTNGQCVLMDVEGLGTANVDVAGTWTGTLTFYVEGRNGTRNEVRMNKADTGSTVTTTTANGAWSGSVASYKTFLVCATAEMTGSARIALGAVGTGGGSAGSTTGTIELVDGDNDPLTDDPNDALKVSVVSGAASGTTDTDDGTVAAAQATLALNISENYWFDGTDWKRMTFGTAGTAAAQVLTVQGVASMTPVIVSATNLDVQSGGADLLTETTGAAILTSTNYAAAFGTAGSADTQVMSVQGIASMTPLQVQSDSANIATQTTLAVVAGDTTDIETAIESVIAPLAGSASATQALAVGGQYNLTPPTLTDGQQVVLQFSSDGSLKVTGGTAGTEYVVNAVAPANPTGNAPVMERDDALSALTEVEGDWTNMRSNANGALWAAIDGTVTVDITGGDTLATVTTVGTVSTVTTLSQFGGNAITLGTGNAGTGSLNVVLATNQPALVGLGIYTEDAGETAGGNLAMSGSVRRDTAASSAGTTGDNATINTDAVGRLWTSGAVFEDVASAGADQLVAVAAIRDDTLDARSGTEGDYEMLHLNANGALWTVDVNSATLVGIVGTEDVAEADARPLAIIGAVRRDTAASSSGTSGDLSTINVDSLGRMWVTGSAVEDAGETAGGLLNMVGTVRRDTAASSAGTTGDNATLNTDATGNLWVNPFSQTQAAATYLTVRLSDGSSFLTPGTDYTHDSALTIGSTTGPMMMGSYDDAATDSVDEGDAGAVRISANRALYVMLRDNAGNERGLNINSSGEALVSCSGCSGTGASHIDDAAFAPTTDDGGMIFGFFDDVAPDSVNEGDGGAVRMSANRNLYVTLRDAAGNERGLNIDASGQLAVTVASFPDNEPFNVQQWAGSTATGGSGTIASGTPRITIATDDDVSDAATLFEANMVAHDAADAGSPLKIGVKAVTSISGVTEVASADRTDLYAGIDGVLITRPHANLEDRVSAVVGVTDGSSTSLVASQGAGLKFCATTFIVSNSSATNVTVDIRDGTAGSVIATIPAAANMGGAVVPLQIPLCTSDATAMAMDPSAAASTVTVTAIGFKTDL